MRTANYAFNLSVSPSAAATPEPASFWLVVPAMSLMLYGFKRRSRLVRFK
jgi:hypothetical protein